MSIEDREISYHSGELLDDVYDTRIQQALLSHPVFPLLYDDVTGLNPEYAFTLQSVEMLNQQNGMCDHGRDHIARVSRNALILSDLAKSVPTPGGAVENMGDAEVLSDGMLLFAAMNHDLSYGDVDVPIDGRSDFDHARRSAMLIDSYQVERSTPDEAKARALILSHGSTLKTALTIDLDTAVSFAGQLYAQIEPISPAQLFVMVHKLADVLDYFRSARVENVSQIYQLDNPYFHIARKLKDYSLTFDGSLVYRAKMDDQFTGIGKDGRPIVSFSDWREATNVSVEADRKNYAQVWQLADLYCNLLGINFKVEEVVS